MNDSAASRTSSTRSWARRSTGRWPSRIRFFAWSHWPTPRGVSESESKRTRSRSWASRSYRSGLMSLVRHPRTARSLTCVTAATSTCVTPKRFSPSTISLASTARSSAGTTLPQLLPVLLPPRLPVHSVPATALGPGAHGFGYGDGQLPQPVALRPRGDSPPTSCSPPLGRRVGLRIGSAGRCVEVVQEGGSAASRLAERRRDSADGDVWGAAGGTGKGTCPERRHTSPAARSVR